MVCYVSIFLVNFLSRCIFNNVYAFIYSGICGDFVRNIPGNLINDYSYWMVFFQNDFKNQENHKISNQEI